MDSPLTRPISVPERADPASVFPRHGVMFASFVLFYFLLRLPMLLSQWDGHDANAENAALLLGLAPGAEDMLTARIGGVPQFSHGFSHPAPPYFLLLMLGKVVRAVVPLESLHGQALIFAVKAVASIIQLAAMLILLTVVVRYVRSRTALAWIWVLAAAPVALYGSNEIQPDSGTGFFLMTLAFVGLLAAQFQGEGRLRMVCLFAAGFFGGLGKNEWTLCLAAALAFTAVVHPFVRVCLERFRGIALIPQDDDIVIVLALPALGLLLGNCVSYLADGANYMGGWYLLRDAVFRGSLASGDFATWASLLKGKSTYIFFHVIVLASAVALLVCEPRRYSALVLLALAAAAALFLSFLGSWVSFSRYFAPAYIGLGVSFLMIMVRAPPSRFTRRVVAATMIAISLQSAVFLTEWIVKGRGKVDVAAMLAKRDMGPPNCVLVIDASFVLDRPDIDFVHNAFGAEFVDQFLARLGRPACPE